MIPTSDFVFCTHAIGREKRATLDSDWDGLYPRNVIIETLGARLGGRGRVLCVERPVSPLTTPWLHPAKFLRWLAGKGVLRDIRENLHILVPHIVFPDSIPLPIPVNGGLLRSVNRRLLKRQLATVMARCGFKSDRRILWLYHPFQVGMLGTVQEDIVVYECHDEYMAGDFPNSDYDREFLRRKEIELLRRADIVFTTSKLLFESKSAYNPNTHYVPNAADVDHFKKTQDPDLQESDKVKGIKKPIIGYLGTIHEATDIELLTHAAEARPEWSFVLMGPVDLAYRDSEAFVKFKGLPNVHVLGWVDYDEIPAIAKSFSACTIPYKVDSEFNQNVNPNKLHEYTAMGKPIVSTRIREVESYGDLIEICRGKEDFVPLLERSMREDCERRISERLSFAEKNSWGVRVDAMLTVIARTLNSNRPLPKDRVRSP